MSKNGNTKNQSTNNLRDGNLRYLGYAHIIGDLLCRWIVPKGISIAYATTTAYILADTVIEANKTCDKDGCGRQTAEKIGDVLIWHSIASICVPTFVVNRIRWGTDYWLAAAGASKVFRLNIPIAIGLLSIPIIIRPIDRLANYLLDETYRKYIQ